VFSVELFNKKVINNQELDEELDFLEELRDFIDNNPSEYRYINEFNIIDVGYEIEEKALINIKDKYIKIADKKISDIVFIDMAKIFKEDIYKNIQPISNDTKDKIYKYITDKEKLIIQDKAENIIDDKISQKAINILKEIMRSKIIDKATYKRLKESVSTGILDIVAINQINNLKGKTADEVTKVIEKII